MSMVAAEIRQESALRKCRKRPCRRPTAAEIRRGERGARIFLMGTALVSFLLTATSYALPH